MLPPEVPHRTIGQFCDHVCMYVRFRPDRAAITAELTAHLEDHMDALVARGFPPETAARQAVAAMGDPEEIGKELDKSHSPLLGWFQIWFRRAVWALAALVLLGGWAILLFGTAPELEVFSPLHHALPGALYYRPRVDYTPLGMLIYLFVINVAILILNWEQRDFGLENIITQAS